MQERQYGRSPYLSALKTKDCTFFPKITRNQANSNNKFLAKSLRKKNYVQSIFKVQQQKQKIQKVAPIAKIPQLDQQRILQSKQYKQMQKQLLEMQHRFKLEMQQIQKKYENAVNTMKVENKKSYEIKYGLWEIKNQIIQLEGVLRDQDNEYNRMVYELGYGQGQVEIQGEQNGEPQSGLQQQQNDSYEGEGEDEDNPRNQNQNQNQIYNQNQQQQANEENGNENENTQSQYN